MSMKLNRADMVRLCVAELREQIDGEGGRAAAAEVAARRAFESVMREGILREPELLRSVASLCGSSVDRFVVDVNLEPTDDMLELAGGQPLFVNVTLRDDEPWAARIMLKFVCRADDAALGAWFAAVRRRKAAWARSQKLAALSDEARVMAVEKVLAESADGQRIMSLLPGLAKRVALDVGVDAG